MIRLIAAREIRIRTRSTAFRVATVILVAAAVAATILSSLFGASDDVPTATVVVSAVSDELVAALEAPSDDIDITTRPMTVSVDGARDALALDGVDAVLVGSVLVSNREPASALVASVQQAVALAEIGARSDALGLDPSATETLLAPSSFSLDVLDPIDAADDVRTGVAGLAAVATFLLIQIFASMTAMSVIEEKSTAVVELLLAHVTSRQLLAGKVLAIAALATLQMLIVSGGLVGALVVTGGIDIPTAVWTSVPLFGATFVVGFLLYCVSFAAAGSLVSRQEDAQQVLLPVMLPLFAGYLVALSSLGGGSTVATVLSYVPFTAPMLIPSQVALGEMSTVQAGVSLAIMSATTVVVFRLAARVYSAAVLQSGGRVRLADIRRGVAASATSA